MPSKTLQPLSRDLVSQLRMRDLEFLLLIAESKSLSGAATNLGLGQPAASRWLREIELLFRAHLFFRDRMIGMRPTSLGQLVLERARVVLADVSALSSQIEAHRAGRGRHLQLGVIPYVPASLLRKVLCTLLQDFDMTVSVVEGATGTLLRSLRLQHLHVVIGRCSAGTLASGLRQEVLFTQKGCLLVHAACPLPATKVMGRGGLADYRWVLPPSDSPTWAAIQAAASSANQPLPKAALETASTKLVHELVSSQEDMVAVLPEDVGCDLERLGGVRVVPFPVPFQMPAVGFIAHAREWNQSHLRAARTTLRSVIATSSELANSLAVPR